MCGFVRSNLPFAIFHARYLLVPMKRIERLTSPLPRECSTTELHRRKNQLKSASSSVHPKSGAGEGNRTLVISLEGFCSTIELHPRQPALPSFCLLSARTTSRTI